MQDLKQAGKYEILERIGEGGFGIVYKGRDPFIKRMVAIKTCTSGSEETRRRFLREAEIAGNIEHPNITVVYDFGFQDDVPYLVQEFLSGEDLDHIIERRERLSLAAKLNFLQQAASGLGFAHEQGITHRDIKPSNLRVLEDGRIKIMDFGIAKVAGVDTQLTQTGTTLGTPAYLSPEQLRGDTVDNRSDIYSFGVLAFELMTYRRLYDADTISSLFYQILHQTPTRVRELWPEVPQGVDDLIARCVEKAASDRPATFRPIIQGFERALEALAGKPDIFLPAQPAKPQARAGADPEKLRQQAMTKARNHIENLLANGNLDAAARALIEAQDDFGDQVPFRTLHARLISMQRQGTAEHSARAAPTDRAKPVPEPPAEPEPAAEAPLGEPAPAVDGPAEQRLTDLVRRTRQQVENRQLTQAEKTLSEARERFGEVPAVIAVSRQVKLRRRLVAGKAALDAGDLEAARDELEKAGDIDPEDTELLHLRERLRSVDEPPTVVPEGPPRPEPSRPADPKQGGEASGVSAARTGGPADDAADAGDVAEDDGVSDDSAVTDLHEAPTVFGAPAPLGPSGKTASQPRQTEGEESAPRSGGVRLTPPPGESGDQSEQPTLLTSWDELQKKHEAIAAAHRGEREEGRRSASDSGPFETAEVPPRERSAPPRERSAPPPAARSAPPAPPAARATPPSQPAAPAPQPSEGRGFAPVRARSVEMPTPEDLAGPTVSRGGHGFTLPRWAWYVAAAVLGLLLVIWLVSLIGGDGDPAPTAATSATVVLDAAPWAVLEELRTETGDAVPWPTALAGEDASAAAGLEADQPPAEAQRTTPLRLQLAPGRYTAVLTHGGQTRSVEIEALADGTSTSQRVEFVQLADEYLQSIGLEAGDDP